MANGGGSFTDYNKTIPGVYTNIITVGRPQTPLTSGITAGAVVMDWQPEGEVFEITADEFYANPVAVTGYELNAPENTVLREIFSHATKFIGYKLNEGGKKAEIAGVGQARNTGVVGNNITVSVLKNANNENRYDVVTYYNDVLKDTQTVGTASEDAIELTGGQVTNASGLPEALQNVKVDFTVKDNIITATYTGIPEGYTVKGQLMLNGKVVGLMKGRLEEETTGNTLSYIFYKGASTAAPYKLNARLQNDSDKTYTTISSEEFTASVKEGAVTGANASELNDNKFVIFNKTGLIEENSGYVFEGGVTGSKVTTESHVNALTALEPYYYNTLFCDSDSDMIKELYVEYTKRQRNQRGKYFQTVVHDYVQADDPGIISVYNKVTDPSGVVNTSSLVCWTAGYSSAIDLKIEMTNKTYDGELKIETGIPQAQLDILMPLGHFIFHQYSLTEVRTLVDVNTFQSFTEEADDQLAENKVVRVIDYIHNEEERVINDTDVGSLNNDPQGRAVLYNRCYSILSGLQRDGVIEDFNASDIEVVPCTDETVKNYKHIAIVRQRYKVTGTIRYVYIISYVVR